MGQRVHGVSNHLCNGATLGDSLGLGHRGELAGGELQAVRLAMALDVEAEALRELVTALIQHLMRCRDGEQVCVSEVVKRPLDKVHPSV
jgi:hypothetical protein